MILSTLVIESGLKYEIGLTAERKIIYAFCEIINTFSLDLVL